MWIFLDGDVGFLRVALVEDGQAEKTSNTSVANRESGVKYEQENGSMRDQFEAASLPCPSSVFVTTYVRVKVST